MSARTDHETHKERVAVPRPIPTIDNLSHAHSHCARSPLLNRFDVMDRPAVRALVLVVTTVILSTAATAGVVGSGTASSCTQAALAAQIPAGGTVTFNCGSGSQTIALPHTLFVGQTNPKITIDGGDTITLDGAGNIDGMVNIFGSAATLPDVTFKHIIITNGNITT